MGVSAVWPAAMRGPARFASRHVRATVVIALVLICGCFAAAAALQMRFARVHALGEAQFFETRRAGEIAQVADASLDRMERAGRAFADNTLAKVPDGEIRNIAVYAPDGTALSMLTGTTAFVRLPREVIAAAALSPKLIGDEGLATLVSAYGGHVVAVSFDTKALVPPALTDHAAIVADGGMTLTGQPNEGRIRAAVGHWPATVLIAPDDDGALAAWYGSLPLYLFVILGPAIVGAWLASLFVGEFERRARASQAVKALRATPSADQRLLVRLAQAERDAIEAQRSKAEFIAHMSHELRTPLNAVIGFSEIIERGMFGPIGNAKYVEYARDIGDAGRGLHAKVGDILEYANLEAGRYPIRLDAFDAAALAQACVEEQAGRAFSRRIALDFAPSVPLAVRADPSAVRRILTSLLSNSLAYTREGGRVRVELREEEGAIMLRVCDSGPGFKPEEASSAGNAFRRFDRKGAQTGTGLGLAIAVALARRTGGALTLASPAGQGTRTELRLPKSSSPVLTGEVAHSAGGGLPPPPR
jgi:signal transduction histidine kinase